jgi:hypothetical protein
MPLTRREALTLMATVCGGAIFGADRILAGVANALAGFSFSASDRALLNEIGETIIPTTADSEGAKAADVGSFMEEIVRDFYTEAERGVFTSGLTEIQSASRTKFSNRNFDSLSPDERHALLLTFEYPHPSPDYYKMVKQLTIWGYFSSEIGAKQALTYVPVPGRYEACVTIDQATTKAWAS